MDAINSGLSERLGSLEEWEEWRERYHGGYLTRDDKDFLRANRLAIVKLGAKALEDAVGGRRVGQPGWKLKVDGSYLNDVHEDAPGVAYYSAASSKHYEISPYVTRDSLRDLAGKEFYRLKAEYSAIDPADESALVGIFRPRDMVIETRYGEPVHAFEQGRWVESVAQEKIPALEKAARNHSRQAAEEMRGDNFDSARKEREKARSIQRRVGISRGLSL